MSLFFYFLKDTNFLPLSKIRRNIINTFNSNFQIYCDMDGVLTDFNYQVLTLDLNIFNYTEKNMWKKITKQGPIFWSNMPWTHDGKLLWTYIKQFNPTILTAVPSHKGVSNLHAALGKKIWVQQNLGQTTLNNLILTTSNKKHKYSSSNKILIDDRINIIRNWVSMGGIGVFHYTAEFSILQLKKIFEE